MGKWRIFIVAQNHHKIIDMEEKKPKSVRKVVIFISYAHKNKDVVGGMHKELEGHRASLRGLEIEIEIEIDTKLGYGDSIEEHKSRPKFTDFTMAYINGNYFRSADCIDESMALFDKDIENPEERLLPVMDPDYKKNFNNKEKKEILQYWEDEKEWKKAKFLEETLLSILEDEIYMDLDELRRENYKSIVEYIKRVLDKPKKESSKPIIKDSKSAMDLEKQKRLVEIAFISDIEEREIALEKYKKKYEEDYYYYFLKGILSFSSGKHKAVRVLLHRSHTSKTRLCRRL